MDVTRRGFLGLLASVTLVGCSDAAESPKRTSRTPTGLSPQEERLVKYFLPMLKRNEDNKKEDEEPTYFSFYHKTNDKVTIGYGVNVEANTSLLSDVEIYHGKKKLSAIEKTTFLDNITTKKNAELAQYTITATDAEYLTKKALVAEIRNTDRILSGTNGKSFLYDLPFCMQALAVDICYNVGQGTFRKYKNFKAALLAHDYDRALAESVVYTNKKEKKTNIRREWSKKRLLRIMRLVQGNAALGLPKIQQLLKADYDANTSFAQRALNRHTKLAHESLIATGELEHIQATLEKTKKLQQSKIASLKPAPLKPDAGKHAIPPKKKTALPLRAKRNGRSG